MVGGWNECKTVTTASDIVDNKDDCTLCEPECDCHETVMLTCAFEGTKKDSHGIAKKGNDNGKRAMVW